MSSFRVHGNRTLGVIPGSMITTKWWCYILDTYYYYRDYLLEGGSVADNNITLTGVRKLALFQKNYTKWTTNSCMTNWKSLQKLGDEAKKSGPLVFFIFRVIYHRKHHIYKHTTVSAHSLIKFFFFQWPIKILPLNKLIFCLFWSFYIKLQI